METQPSNIQTGNSIDISHLFASLRSEREHEFLLRIDFAVKVHPIQIPAIFEATNNDETLLIAACKHGLVIAVERILHLKADINSSIDTAHGIITPIECVCEHGNWKVLELLLCSPKLDISKCSPLLSIVLPHIGEKVTEKCDYEKCFQLLLIHRNVDINQLDASECNALHYAVKYNNIDAIKALLKHGAYIGQKNHFDQYPISNMNPELLEKHFDQCISTNGLRDGERHFQIEFDYKNLVPPGLRVNYYRRTNSEFKKTYDLCPNEITPIEIIAVTNDLRHLIRHPLIASFVILKWSHLSLIFYVNFILCLLFGITSSIYILTCYNREDSIIELVQLLRILIFLLTSCMIIRKVLQFWLLPKLYLRSIENYLECAMIVLMILILLNYFYDTVRRTIAATTLLLIGIELFYLAGSLSFFSFSTHYVMLKTVICSFLKSLSLYVILLLSFASAFFTLLREREAETWLLRSDIPDGNEDSDKPREDFNKFNTLKSSIIKTLVMSTGEFDAADIQFEMNPSSYILFISFLFVISTVMLNLLNQLAVNNIQIIKSDAELTNFVHRCKLLALYETALVDKRLPFSFIVCSKHFARDAISVLRMLRPHYRIGIMPNANNQITIPHIDHGIMNDDDYEPMQCNSCLAYFGRCSRMNDKVVKMANDVLKKVNAEKFKILKKDPLRDEIDEMKASLEMIKHILLKRESMDEIALDVK